MGQQHLQFLRQTALTGLGGGRQEAGVSTMDTMLENRHGGKVRFRTRDALVLQILVCLPPIIEWCDLWSLLSIILWTGREWTLRNAFLWLIVGRNSNIPMSRVYGASSSTFTDQRGFIGTNKRCWTSKRKHQVDRLQVIQSLTIYIYIQVKWSSSIITDSLNLISFPCYSREVKDIGAFVFLGELQFSINPAPASQSKQEVDMVKKWHKASRPRVDDENCCRDVEFIVILGVDIWAMKTSAPGCLGYIGDCTTQLCGDYNKSL